MQAPSMTYASMLVDILLRSLPHDIVVEYHRRHFEDKFRHYRNQNTDGTASDHILTDDRLNDHLVFIEAEVESCERSEGWGIVEANQEKNVFLFF